MSKPWIYASILVVASALAGGVAHEMNRLTEANAPADPSPQTVHRHIRNSSLDVNLLYGQAAVPRDDDGHFWANSNVNGRIIRFMVDTGASTVALPRAEAIRLGLSPETFVFDQPVRTANGEVKAARVMLASVEVGSIRVENVEALIVNEGLDTPLLGMSFLGRLSKLEITSRQLVLKR